MARDMQHVILMEKCALIEKRCAAVYRRFSEMHLQCPEMTALWSRVAVEEDNHAFQFDMMCKVVGEIEQVIPTESQLADALAQLESLLELLQTQTLDRLEALQLAVRLEDYLSQFHSAAALVCRDPKMVHLLDAMMQSDLAHGDRLQKALEAEQRRQ